MEIGLAEVALTAILLSGGMDIRDRHGSLPSHSTPPCKLTHRELPPADATNSTNQLCQPSVQSGGDLSLPPHDGGNSVVLVFAATTTTPWPPLLRGRHSDALVASGLGRFAMAGSKRSIRATENNASRNKHCWGVMHFMLGDAD